MHMQRDKSRGTSLSKRGCLYKGSFPQDGSYSVSMKVGVFIIASLYNDGFICCRIIRSWFVRNSGSMEGGCTLAFDKVKGGWKKMDKSSIG